MKNLLSGCILFFFVPLLSLCFCNGTQQLYVKKENEQKMLQYLLYRNSLQFTQTEALKAQAIVFRSEMYYYTDKEWKTLLKQGVETEQEEAYVQNRDSLQNAVKETEGMIVTSEGRRSRAVYHTASAGKTRDGTRTGILQYQMLLAVDSPWDLSMPGAHQSFSFSDTYLLHSFFQNESTVHIAVLKTDDSGYVQEVLWGKQHISGDQVREYLGLSSSCFTVEKKENTWVFECQGIGHGLGLSLYGCQKLAEQGKTYAEILKYYYPAYEIATYEKKE